MRTGIVTKLSHLLTEGLSNPDQRASLVWLR